MGRERQVLRLPFPAKDLSDDMRPVRQIAFYIVLLLGHSRPPLAKAETIAHPDNGGAGGIFPKQAER
jgi:hypothetical protein